MCCYECSESYSFFWFSWHGALPNYWWHISLSYPYDYVDSRRWIGPDLAFWFRFLTQRGQLGWSFFWILLLSTDWRLFLCWLGYFLLIRKKGFRIFYCSLWGNPALDRIGVYPWEELLLGESWWISPGRSDRLKEIFKLDVKLGWHQYCLIVQYQSYRGGVPWWGPKVDSQSFPLPPFGLSPSCLKKIDQGIRWESKHVVKLDSWSYINMSKYISGWGTIAPVR